MTTRPRREQLVVGQERGELVAEAQEKELVAGDQEKKLVVGQERGVGGWRAERQAAEEKLAWKNGGAVNTRHRAEKRGSIR